MKRSIRTRNPRGGVIIKTGDLGKEQLPEKSSADRTGDESEEDEPPGYSSGR